MKQKQKERLKQDLIRLCKQIGIPEQQYPKLITERKEYQELKVANGESKHSGGYGECNGVTGYIH